MASCAASQGWWWSSSSQRLVSVPSHREVWDYPSSFLIRTCSTEILSGTQQPRSLSRIDPLRCPTKCWWYVSLLITMSGLTLEIALHPTPTHLPQSKGLLFQTFGALLLSTCWIVSFPQNGGVYILTFQRSSLLCKSFNGCCIHSGPVFADLQSANYSNSHTEAN